MSKEASIQCPNCSEQIDVNEIFYHQVENGFDSSICNYGSIEGIAINNICNVKVLRLSHIV